MRSSILLKTTGANVVLSDRIAASDDVVAREVGGEMVLLDLASGTYFGLNEVGGRIWQLIDEQSRSVEDICDIIEAEFEVSREQLEGDIAALINDLLERNLLIRE